MGTTKKTAVAATRGRPKSVSAADKTSRLTASGKITAVSKYRMDVPAVTEDHPAYGLTAGFTAKGARSGVASRLSQVERSDLEHLLRERLKKGKMALCDAFGIAPAEYDQHFDPKLQATSLTNAVEKLAVKSAAKMRRLEA
jgi:lambda repressor-like predicted transcriptional regulator